MARGRRGGAKSDSTRKHQTEGVPDVYREMLADVASSSPIQRSEEGRPVKRRRVGGRLVTQGNEELSPHQSSHSSKVSNVSEHDELFEDIEPTRQQIVQTESEDSADSEANWEEVEIPDQVKQEDTPEPEQTNTDQLRLVLGRGDDENDGYSHGRAKRKPMTTQDKKLRLEIHKMYLCSLLAHVHLRNHWCNDNVVHTTMKRLLTKKTISYLNPDEGKSQFQRSRSFMDGLSQASDAFKGEFKITARGMGKPRWADSTETLALLQPPDDIDLPMQISDFREAATQLEASRDVGAQLFCALLRSAGVDTRLVCSLQPLPFQPAHKVELHQVKRRSSRPVEERFRTSFQAGGIINEPSNREGIMFDAGQNERGLQSQPESPKEIRDAPPKIHLPSKKRRKPIRESKYPIYWVEAFNEAVQKWVPIDPLVTKTIAKASKLEPPAGEPENHMCYLVAFEDDGSARDVTRRYVKAYNAKTRRDRVEVTNGGDRWWRRVMKMYRRSHSLDRDQVEDAELASKEAAEPMPRNVQDFKDHPYYALERHLKRHEVIYPKREVGKIGTGRAGGTTLLEPIFRRRDVHMVKSADKWYRVGREIKPGEQPLKRVPARRKRELSVDPEDQDAADDENAGTALYAADQTVIYTPPPVVNGRIPKNVYGNLDVYVPSMVPPGGAHIAHPETARAARIIGIDYADAVTGFVFKGRHGTAVTKGAVVAAECAEAVEAVIRALEDDRARAEEEKRSVEALRMWKRMLAGLRIMERIEGYDVEGERFERETALKEEMSKVDLEENDENEGGGFLPDRDAVEDVQPTAGSILAEAWTNVPGDEGGGFLVEGADDAGQEIDPQPRDHFINDFEYDGGGFLADGADDELFAQHKIDPPTRDHLIDSLKDDGGGGFLVNDEDADAEEALQEMNPRDVGEPPFVKPLRSHRSASEDRQEDSSFVAKEAETCKEPNSRAAGNPVIETTDASTKDHTSNTAMPDLTQDELEEATMLQQLYETGGVAQPPVEEQQLAAFSPDDRTTEHSLRDQQAESTVAVESHTSPSPPVSASSAGDEGVKEQSVRSDGSDDEKGSLLSHDPDDEDADPEWLT